MLREQLLEYKIYKERRKKQKRNNRKVAPKGVFPRMNIFVFTNLINFFRKNGFVSSQYINKTIVVPKFFSFENNSDDSITFFKLLLSSYLLSDNSILIDFTNCESVDISNAMLLDIMLKELNIVKRAYNEKYYNYITKSIRYKESKHIKVNKCLRVFRLIKDVKDVQDGEGFLYLGLKKGWAKRVSYKENNKGATCKEIREFLNNSLKESNAILNPVGENVIDKLLSEILNNAEDHSIHNEWYVNGVSYKEIVDGEPIIELNLGILNLGFSIAEGLSKSKEKNVDTIKEINEWYIRHYALMEKKGDICFTKDDLYTLYCLQEGISRLKYEDESRGRGTMNFIRAFITLGSFGEKNPQYKSHLNIISGKTIVNCDNKRKPYRKENTFFLSLNKDNDINLLPDKEYLKHTHQKFLGTFLEVKIYLNKTYFKEILP
jgi:hypothetical protein